MHILNFFFFFEFLNEPQCLSVRLSDFKKRTSFSMISFLIDILIELD